MASEYILVLTTSPDEPTATRLSEALIKSALAACVNILPAMQSIYRWDGEMRSSQEHQLFIKTTRNKYSKLEAAIRDNHPYELPEIIAIPIEDGLAGYLQWVTECCEANN